LSASLEEQYQSTQAEKEQLIAEHGRLEDMKTRLERDKSVVETDRRRLERQGEMERARLEVEGRRQLAEWAEINQQQKHLHKLRENDQQSLEEHRVRVH